MSAMHVRSTQYFDILTYAYRAGRRYSAKTFSAMSFLPFLIAQNQTDGKVNYDKHFSKDRYWQCEKCKTYNLKSVWRCAYCGNPR